uniref:Uncharacterized protein n=1 Tax=Oryza sativa subsp. japonica TaxID=39947 RepID=Q10CI9_ORYSJ|nr:hypothetical protein LOC_Os03g55189 [Oryza sativa Japonica Group]
MARGRAVGEDGADGVDVGTEAEAETAEERGGGEVYSLILSSRTLYILHG